MRTNFGDYRAKMASEEKSAKAELAKGKISEGLVNRDKVAFVKKSASLSGLKNPPTAASPKTEFRFAFNVE